MRLSWTEADSPVVRMAKTEILLLSNALVIVVMSTTLQAVKTFPVTSQSVIG